MTPQELDALQALWEDVARDVDAYGSDGCEYMVPQDAAFFRAAFQSVPQLIGEVRRLQAFEAEVKRLTPRLCLTCVHRRGSLTHPPCDKCRDKSTWEFDPNHHEKELRQ